MAEKKPRKPKELTELQKAVKDVELTLDEVQKRNPKEVSEDQLVKMVQGLRKERAAWVSKQAEKGKEE